MALSVGILLQMSGSGKALQQCGAEAGPPEQRAGAGYAHNIGQGHIKWQEPPVPTALKQE